MKNLITDIEDNKTYSVLSTKILKFFLSIQINGTACIPLPDLQQILGYTRVGIWSALNSLRKEGLISWDASQKLYKSPRAFYLNQEKLKELAALYDAKRKFKKTLSSKNLHS